MSAAQYTDAPISSGTTPASHGIIGNDWYDKEI
ncbi:MAG TPA: hypothetical protein DEQ63_01280, partial [Flavobacteriaceae bacterium]|nr:hypothetical protein [Flavobacteriaceae bacterium]